MRNTANNTRSSVVSPAAVPSAAVPSAAVPSAAVPSAAVPSAAEILTKKIFNLVTFGLCILGSSLLILWLKTNQPTLVLNNDRMLTLLGFTGIALLGVLLCGTDIIFKQISTVGRVIPFTLLGYIGYVQKLASTDANVFSSIPQFIGMTAFYCFICFLVGSAWYFFNFVAVPRLKM